MPAALGRMSDSAAKTSPLELLVEAVELSMAGRIDLA
jgi:hypothetical protein